MRKFTPDELKARNFLITVARNMTNVERGAQPYWEKALAKQRIEMKSLKDSLNPASAEIVYSKDFDFIGFDETLDSVMTILMIAPIEMVLESGNLLKGEKKFSNQWADDKKSVQTLFRLVSEDGFTLEMNAKILEEIQDCEREKIEKDKFLNIPFIVISGLFIQIFCLRLEKFHFEEINHLQAKIKNGIDASAEEALGCVLGNIRDNEYLRPWTYYDLFS